MAFISVLIFFIVIGSAIGKALKSFIPEDDDPLYYPEKRKNYKEPPTIIHNHYINNNLHITEEQLRILKDNSKS